jgi:RNA polymerase sigma-B factor
MAGTEASATAAEPVAHERALLARFAALDPSDPQRADIRSALVVLHQPLVRSLARRYAGRGEPLDDLVQAANEGLVKAIDRYDPARGDSLAGLLVPTVLGEIRRHFRDRTWAVRVPRGARDLAVRMRGAREELEQRLGRAPTVPELAVELGVDDDAVLDALGALDAYRWEPLEAGPNSAEAERRPEAGRPDTDLEQVLTREALRPMIAELSDRERTLLRLRFVEERSQAEIAEALGIDQSSVSRLLARTLVSLRTRLGDQPW